MLDDDVEVNGDGDGLVVEPVGGEAELADSSKHAGVQVRVDGFDHLDVAALDMRGTGAPQLNVISREIVATLPVP